MKPQAGLALGGRYRLVRQIAVGGMGEVWVAKDESLARDIAIKVLKEEFVGNADFLNRFRIEARNAASLSHAHIAQLYDYGEQDGSAYLVMELVNGEPMSDLLEREPILPTDKLLTILAQTSRALHAAHVGGVVHRDIKPGNIIIEHTGDVKITDFGVSLAANQIPMTAAGMVMGTAQYLSPEQAVGRAATGASDIYALGIVAYEGIAGNRPFTGKTPVDIAVAHVNEQVPPLPKTADPELAALIMRMLAKDPLERPRSGAALAHTFETIAHRLAQDPWPGLPRAAAPRAGSTPDALGGVKKGAPAVGHALAASKAVAVEDSGPQIGQARPGRSTPRSTAAPGHGAPSNHGAASSSSAAPAGVPAPTRASGHGRSTNRSGSRTLPPPPGPGVTSSSGAPSRGGAASTPGQRPGPGLRPVPNPTPNAAGHTSGAGGNRRESTDGRTAPRAPSPHEARRGPAQRAATQPTTLVERIKALGAFTLSLVAIIGIILIATVAKVLISAEVGTSDPASVRQKVSQVEFTSAHLAVSEVGECRGGSPNCDSATQVAKDAKW